MSKEAKSEKEALATFQRLKERLWSACELGDGDSVYLTIRRAEEAAQKHGMLDKFGSLVDDMTDDGATPLYVACKNGHSDCAINLLKAGALPGAPTRAGGFTPLWAAAQKGSDKCCDVLLQQRGINVNKACKDGRTPLYAACEGGNANTVSLLLERGATMDNKRNDGSTALIVASYFGHAEVVELLCNAGAKLLPADEDGTALENALKRQKTQAGKGGDMARQQVVTLLESEETKRVVLEGLERGQAPETAED